MSETVRNAVGTSAAGTVPTPRKTVPLKYFDWLYILVGLSVLIFGPLTLEYPKSYEDVWTPTSSLNINDVLILAVLGILIALLGFLDYRNTKSKANKPYFAAILIVLGIVLIPLFSYYGVNGNFTGLLGTASYDLAGVSAGGFLLIFAGLGEMYLLRKQTSMHM